ncbi:hypothetical protein [Sphingomonas fennica]|uniref:Uncharacterized protein n=1 Tax=Edaphosphingomonas fennica TaxID=114404 RepID=A0A2T4HWR8_9SPHN|nr:hypothetical protein [Sphingomonas fennica]PTD20242.1 hypothetical protein CV103_11705 [Sphingomonas fennica]
MTPPDAWTIAAVIAFLALLASLRLSVPALEGSRLAGFIAHPALLLPLVLAVPMTVGLMMTGAVPVAPLSARDMVRADYGYWAGIAALITVATAELWLLWTPSMVARRFARPESREALKGLPILNLAFGAGFLALVWNAWS